MRTRERFRNLEQVPTRQRPATIELHRHGHDWMTRLLRQQHRAHLRDVTRTFWTIDRERRRAAGAHQPCHLDYRANAAARARTAHRTVTESLNKPCYVLAVETARRHHHDAPFAPPVSRQKNAIVPEDVDRLSAIGFRFLVVLPTAHLETRRHSDQIYSQVKREVSRANQKMIFERVVRQVGEFVSAVDALFDRQIRLEFLFHHSLQINKWPARLSAAFSNVCESRATVLDSAGSGFR